MSQSLLPSIPPHLRGLPINHLPTHLRILHEDVNQVTVSKEVSSADPSAMETSKVSCAEKPVKDDRASEKEYLPPHLRVASTLSSMAPSSALASTVRTGGVALAEGDHLAQSIGTTLEAFDDFTLDPRLADPRPRIQSSPARSHHKLITTTSTASIWDSDEDLEVALHCPQMRPALVPKSSKPPTNDCLSSKPASTPLASKKSVREETKSNIATSTGKSRTGDTVKWTGKTNSDTVPYIGRVRTGDAADWTKKTEKGAKFHKPFPCTYKNCNLGFNNLKALQRHKVENHEYCKMCDLDCDDFQDLLDHKILSPKHITCHICGEDFRSSGGRDGHIIRLHPTEQKIPCPGCNEVFIRAGGLVNHIEKDLCSKITKQHFQRSRAMQALVVAHMSSLGVPEEDDSLLDLGEADIGGSPGGVPISQEVLVPENAGGTFAASFPALASTKKAESEMDQKENEDEQPVAPVPGAETGVWGQETAKALFPEAKPSDQYPDVEKLSRNITKQRYTHDKLAELVLGKSDTVSNLRLPNGASLEAIDPKSPKYDPEAFKNVLGRYVCPHANCK